MRVAIVLLCFASASFGQGIFDSHDAHKVWTHAITPPTSSDNGKTMVYSTSTGKITWATAAGGSGCGTIGSAGQLVIDDGSGGCSSSGDFVITSHTLAGGASAILDLHSQGTNSFKVPGGFTTGVLHVTGTTGATAGGLIVAADITNNTITGTQLAASLALVTPILGTPTSGTATNITGLPEGGLSLTDITTNNASTSKHGFLLKLDNNSAHFMNGQGAWATPSGSGSAQSFSLNGGTSATETLFNFVSTSGINLALVDNTGTSIDFTITPDTAVLATITTAQSFTAGAKKTFTASALNNPLRIPPTANGSIPVGGDLNIDASRLFQTYDDNLSAWHIPYWVSSGDTPCTGTQLVSGHATATRTGCVGETGTGSAVLASAPTISNPIISGGGGTADLLSVLVNGAAVTNNIVLNSQSTAYTAVIGDAGKIILHPTADNNARTDTIPANSSVAYALGTCLTFVNQINTVTIAITSDTLTLAGAGTTGSRTLAANGWATACKVGTTAWFISGSGLT